MELRRVAVLARAGRTISDDVRGCLTCLRQAGIDAHEGSCEQVGIVWLHQDSDLKEALGLLGQRGFDVVEFPPEQVKS
jgi:hypothetical protein